ncbi:hypothetical protein Tco_0070899 [Tanacetum coccineum]
MLISKKKALNIRLPLLEHLNRTTLSKDRTALLLRLLKQCSQLLCFHYHFGLKQLQPHAILRTDQIIISTHGRRPWGENLDKMKEKGFHCVWWDILLVEGDIDLDTTTTRDVVKNVSLGLSTQGLKASDYDNYDPRAPKDKIVVLSSEDRCRQP